MAGDDRHTDFVVSGKEALHLTSNGERVLKARYLKKDEHGQVVERPEDLFTRVAQCIAEVETACYGATRDERDEWARRFYNLMVSGRFMPNSPTLMNAGREMGMLSACFVLPVRDSVDAIFDSIKHTALIQKAGGGTGFAFDELRPTGDYIHSSGGTTSGPISFWRAFSEATNAIQQGAFRRGANMGMMYVHHPDILKFLHAKQDTHAFSNYNISVKLTDEWMRQLQENPDSPHIVRNPRTGQTYYIPSNIEIWEYDVRSLIAAECDAPDPNVPAYVQTPRPIGPVPADYEGKVYTKRQVWETIVQNAWATGEPGVVFIDQINRYNPTPNLGRIEATNPCGEQPLLPYEACNLGSINLGKFVRNGGTDKVRVDWDALRETVHQAVRFLDNVIDANRYPLEQIDAMCKKNRKIGLGLMGFADALFQLSVGYNTPEGVAWAERFMKFVNDEAHNYSEQLAQERGSFPNWTGSLWDTVHHRPMRNASCTTMAPTGTISIIANCSGGVEPLFSLVFYRNVLRGKGESQGPLLEVNEFFRKVMQERGLYSEGLMDHIATDGTLAHIDEIPSDIRRVFVCAHDIAPEWHIKMQAAFQRHCDASISKTINFPKDAKAEDVDKIYRMAFELGCKGVTVYRDGCRESQPMALKELKTDPPAVGQENANSARTDVEAASPQRVDLEPRQLPEIVSGLRIRQMTPFGNIHVKITVDPRTGQELEVFAQLGKGGDVAASDLEAICRMISLWLRAGGSLKHVIQQLKGIGSSLQIPTKDGRIMSLGDGLARALMKYQRAKEVFGLEDLLLGRADLTELTNTPQELKTREPESGGSHDRNNGGNGNGGNGKGGNGKREPQPMAMATAGALTGGPTRPEVRLGGGWMGMLAESMSASMPTTPRTAFKVKCPECGADLVYGEGCVTCQACGWAKC
jgi:ribonucleoside-diphosphate reductase alpha chain